MKKRRRTAVLRARKATQTKPRTSRTVRPRATASAVTSEPVWMGPALKVPKVTAAVKNPAIVDDGSEHHPRSRSWQCRYGCIGFKLSSDGVMFHHRDCPYWNREGRNKTPF